MQERFALDIASRLAHHQLDHEDAVGSSRLVVHRCFADHTVDGSQEEQVQSIFLVIDKMLTQVLDGHLPVRSAHHLHLLQVCQLLCLIFSIQ
jgi:hypothetical protein